MHKLKKDFKQIEVAAIVLSDRDSFLAMMKDDLKYKIEEIIHDLEEIGLDLDIKPNTLDGTKNIKTICDVFVLIEDLKEIARLIKFDGELNTEGKKV